MGSTTHLVRRGAIYYFRMAVPRHLVEKVGRMEVSSSLRTSNRKVATIRCRRISNSLDVYFQGLDMGTGQSIEEIDAEIKSYFQRALNWSLEYTNVLMDDRTLDADIEAAGLPALIEDYQRQLKSGEFSKAVLSDANDLLAPLLTSGAKADPGAIKHACRGVILAKIEQSRRLIGDLTGNYSDLTAGDPRFVGMLATGLPPLAGDDTEGQPETLQLIANLYREHRKESGAAAKTLSDFDVTMRLAFEVISPEKPINAIHDADVRSLRDLIKKIPPNAFKAKSAEGKSFSELAQANDSGARLSYATQEKRLRFFRSMLHWACDEGYIAIVPGKNISVSAKKQTVQTGGPYSTKDLELIFSTPVYTGRLSETRAGTPGDLIIKDGKFWVPLIGLFSGMRLGEIVQLHRKDVHNVDGVWVFDINRSEDENKKVKTETSLRQVPVHKTLIELGLLTRLDDSMSDKRLFPDLLPGKNGFYSHNFSKWWGRYGNTFKFRGERKVFHSFRHLFTDALRNLQAPDYVLKAVLGHSDKSITNKYGLGASANVLSTYVNKVQFDVEALNQLFERVNFAGQKE